MLCTHASSCGPYLAPMSCPDSCTTNTATIKNPGHHPPTHTTFSRHTTQHPPHTAAVQRTHPINQAANLAKPCMSHHWCWPGCCHNETNNHQITPPDHTPCRHHRMVTPAYRTIRPTAASQATCKTTNIRQKCLQSGQRKSRDAPLELRTGTEEQQHPLSASLHTSLHAGWTILPPSLHGQDGSCCRSAATAAVQLRSRCTQPIVPWNAAHAQHRPASPTVQPASASASSQPPLPPSTCNPMPQLHQQQSTGNRQPTWRAQGNFSFP
jgi:hypothetical protein